MATSTTPKDDIRFIVDVRPSKYSDHGRLDAVAYPIYLEGGKIRNCSWSTLADRGADYADLRIEGWVDRDSVNKDDFYWGFTPIEYREVFTIDQARAESMAKTLRRVNKRVESLTTKFGYAPDYASFLSYVAQAVGADPRSAFARRTDKGRGWTHDECEYRWLDINGLRSYFQDELRKWRGDD
jgi:hypothetical protein